jgi:hypothetical protein
MSGRRIFGAAAFGFMGLGAWHVTNSIWSQLPAMIVTQPEGKALGTQLNLAVQCGSIFVFLFMFFRDRLSLNTIIPLISFTAAASLFGVCYTGMETIRSHSVVTIGIAFVGGSIGNLNNVVLWPFASKYIPLYSTTLSFGLSLSPVLASALAAIEDIGNSDINDFRFSVSDFLLISAITISICFSFVLLITRTSFFRESEKKEITHALGIQDEETTPLMANTKVIPPLTKNQQFWFRSRCGILFIICIWMFG